MSRLERLREMVAERSALTEDERQALDMVVDLCDNAEALANALGRWAENAVPPELRAFREWNEG